MFNLITLILINMFGNKPKRLEGISLKDIPIYNSNQTKGEETLYPLALDSENKLVRKSTPGFGGAGGTPTLGTVVAAEGTVLQGVGSFFIIDPSTGADELRLRIKASNPQQTRNVTSFLRSSSYNIVATQNGDFVSNTISSSSYNIVFGSSTIGLSTPSIQLNRNTGIQISIGSGGTSGRLDIPTSGRPLLSSRESNLVVEAEVNATKGFGIKCNTTINSNNNFAFLRTDNISTERQYQFTNKDGILLVGNVEEPASMLTNGELGEIRITSTHLYICINTNTWRRIPLTTF